METLPVVRLQFGAAPESPAARITNMSFLEVLVDGRGRRRPPLPPNALLLHLGSLPVQRLSWLVDKGTKQ